MADDETWLLSEDVHVDTQGEHGRVSVDLKKGDFTPTSASDRAVVLAALAAGKATKKETEPTPASAATESEHTP